MQRGYTKQYGKNIQVSAVINQDILNNFRDVVYQKSGLKKGDFSKYLQQSMQEFIKNNSTSNKNISDKK